MLAIAGGKGGSGKTTTALGLARALDGPTLVADADVDMPDLHALAGVDREPTLADLDGRPPDAVAQPRPGAEGVSVLPAPRATDDADPGAALARVAAADVPALLDCPGGAGPDAAAPIRAADRALLVAGACVPALRDAAKTAAMARALGTDVVGAVLTRTTAAPPAVADVLGCPVLGTVPEVDPPVLPRRVTRTAYARLASALAAGQGILRSGP
ncbi:MAG: MinD/ParA family protein [Haloferacaceae archaeon]